MSTHLRPQSRHGTVTNRCFKWKQKYFLWSWAYGLWDSSYAVRPFRMNIPLPSSGTNIYMNSSTTQKTPVFLIIQWVLYTMQPWKEFVLYWWARFDERRVWFFYLVLTRRSAWGTAVYSGTTSTNSPSFCLTDFSSSLTNLIVLLPQSRDCSCYLTRRILAPQPIPLEQTHCLTYTVANPPILPCDISVGWLKLPSPEGGRLCRITPAIPHDDVQLNCNFVFLVSRWVNPCGCFMIEWEKEIFSVSVNGIGSNLNFACITSSKMQCGRQGLIYVPRAVACCVRIASSVRRTTEE